MRYEGIFLCLVGVLGFRSSRRTGNFVGQCLNFSWFVSLLVFSIVPIQFYPLSFETVSTILVYLVSFNLFSSFGVQNRSAPTGSQSEFRRRDARVLFWIFMCGAIVYVSSIQARFGFEVLLSNRAAEIRATADYFSSLNPIARIAFLMGPCAVFVYLRSDAKRREKVLASFVVIVLLTTSLNRVLPIIAILWSAMPPLESYLERRKRRTAKIAPRGKNAVRLAMSGAVLLLGFNGVASLLGKTGTADVRMTQYSERWFSDSAFLTPSLYLVGPLAGFNQLITPSANNTFAVRDHSSFGRGHPFERTLKPVYEIVGKSDTEISVAFVYVPVPFNVYSGLEYFYLDGGVILVVVGGAFLGFLAKKTSRTTTFEGANFRYLMGLAAIANVWNPLFSTTYVWVYALTVFALSKRAMPMEIERGRNDPMRVITTAEA
jgi:hypothetical protein